MVTKLKFLFSQHIVFLIFLAALAIFPFSASAATYVSGVISTDTVWTASSSPYVVQGVMVNQNVTLTIEAGVVVKFDSSTSELIVEGTVNANGIVSQPIVFTSIKDDSVGGDTNGDGNLSSPSQGDWVHIIFIPDAEGIFTHTTIRYGGYIPAGPPGPGPSPNTGIVNIGATISLDHVSLTDNGEEGFVQLDSGSSTLHYTLISGHFKNGIYIDSGEMTISDSHIVDNGAGIFAVDDSSVPIVTITGTEIKNNTHGIISFGASLSVNNSSIHSNILSGLRNSRSGLIDATNNWWGDASGPTTPQNPGGTGENITYGIFGTGNGSDPDNAVSFSPWLTEDPLQAPVEQNPTLSNLSQFKFDGETLLDEGVITTHDSVVIKATLTDPNGDDVKLQVELKESGQSFDETDIIKSDFVFSGSEAVIARYGLINGVYKWRARAVDSQDNFSEWQEFGAAGNVDFAVKLVPLYTQNISQYPSIASTTVWSREDYGNGGTGGFAEYNFTLNISDNYTLIINGKDDNAADGTRTTIEARLYAPSQGSKNPLILKTISWPSGDGAYKNLYLNLGYISAGDYILRLTSVADYYDVNDTSEAGDLNVYLDWLKIKGSVAPEIHIEAENITSPNKLVGGELVENQTIVKIDGYPCGRTIAQCGCYMVSAVMLARYYDDGAISDLRGDINPLRLNEWMKINDGYTNGNILPSKIAEYSSSTLAFDSQSGNYLNNYSLLNEYLDNNWPVMAKSDAWRGNKNRNHFLIIDSQLAATYSVKDPAWYNTNNLSDDRTGGYIRNYEAGFDGLRLYQPSDGQPIKSITFVGHSPIELLITDPQGRRLGKNPITNIEYSEIPDSAYYSDSIDNATDEFLAAGEESKFAYISNPIDGQYTIQIIGTEQGNYSVNSLVYDANSQSYSQIFSGQTQANLITQLNLNYTPDQPENIIIEPIDTTPPEARIYFDKDNQTLKIEGIDDFTQNPTVTVIKDENDDKHHNHHKHKKEKEVIYQIEDEAGNITKLFFKKIKFQKHHSKKVKVKLVGIQYNDGEIIEIEAKLKYEWLLNKEGEIKRIRQKIKAEGQFKIKAKYKYIKDETRIKIKYEENEEKIEYTLPGLVIIKLITQSGELGFEF